MRRTALSVFAALVAAGIIGTAITVLLWDDDEPLAVGTPSAVTPTPTQSPLTLPSATPTATGASPTPTGATATPTAAPTDAPGPVPSSQPARSVNCNSTPTFCTPTGGTAQINDDKLVNSGTTNHPANYGSVPNTTMTWTINREGGGQAGNGDEVSNLQVTVEIHNDTNKTWVVPRREIVLVVLLNGDQLHELVTSGADFEMRPGGRLTARYDVPLAFEGKYSWRGKTSFYSR